MDPMGFSATAHAPAMQMRVLMPGSMSGAIPFPESKTPTFLRVPDYGFFTE